MYGDHIISLMPMTVGSIRTKVENFLAENGLKMDKVDTYLAATSDDYEEILAGGGIEKDVIKCVAVSEKAREEGLAGGIITQLINIAHENGYSTVKVFTKPENKSIFESMGFALLAETDKAVLMENGQAGMAVYLKYLSGLRESGKNGAIVMNANPFTKGHRYLVEKAAAQVDNLYVIVVKEDNSRFSYAERYAMIKAGTKDIKKVIVCEGSNYAISDTTFPTYFLKKTDDATDVHIGLDLDIFAKHIAPALGVTVRFAGSEPLDKFTANYNRKMAKQLPKQGIEFKEVPRNLDGDEPISATALRKALEEGKFTVAANLAYKTSVPYLLADLAVRSLEEELDATPKPGLVDKAGRGAHEDMDYGTMKASIKALRPYFVELAFCGDESKKMREIGLRAEKDMLAATGGVNTHRGSLFAVGLALTIAAYLWDEKGYITEKDFRKKVAKIAKNIPESQNSHGAQMRAKYDIEGALDNARGAWHDLFEDWLPFYRNLNQKDEYRIQKLLLRIMSTLDDTNILYRKGEDRADKVKYEAKTLLKRFSAEGLEELNREFISERISPGGSADMVSLTIFINNIFN